MLCRILLFMWPFLGPNYVPQSGGEWERAVDMLAASQLHGLEAGTRGYLAVEEHMLTPFPDIQHSQALAKSIWCI